MPVLSFYYVRNFLVPLIHIDKKKRGKENERTKTNTDKTIFTCQYSIIVKLFSLSFVNIEPFCFVFHILFISLISIS